MKGPAGRGHKAPPQRPMNSPAQVQQGAPQPGDPTMTPYKNGGGLTKSKSR